MSLVCTQFETLCVAHTSGLNWYSGGMNAVGWGWGCWKPTWEVDFRGLVIDGVQMGGGRGNGKGQRILALGNEPASSHRCPWWVSCFFWAYISHPWPPVWEASMELPGSCSALPRRK